MAALQALGQGLCEDRDKGQDQHQPDKGDDQGDQAISNPDRVLSRAVKGLAHLAKRSAQAWTPLMVRSIAKAIASMTAAMAEAEP